MKETLELGYRSYSQGPIATNNATHMTLDLDRDFDEVLMDITDFLREVGYEFPAGTTLGVVASDEAS